MKKAFLIWICIIIGCVSAFLLTLCFGKYQRVICVIEQETFSFLMVRGELKECDSNAEGHSENYQNEKIMYIKNNIIGKYSCNYDTIEKIKEYLSYNNGKIVSVENGGYTFIGLSWIVNQLKNLGGKI